MSGNRSLFGLDVRGSYRRFLQVPDAGADGVLRDVCDGEGDILPLRISTTGVEVTTPPTTPNSVATKAYVDSGVIVPAYEIWGVIGQSNAQGRGTMDADIELPNPRLYQFGSTPPGTEANSRFQIIFNGADPLYHPQRINRLTGAASTFARLRLDAIPSSRRLLLVPLAWGGTSLVVSPARWSVTGPGDLLANAVAQANAALAAARAVYPGSYIKGFLWQQGESDGDLDQATYAAAQDALTAYLRANVTDAAGALFIVGGMTPEWIAEGGAEGIRDAQRETPGRVLRSGHADCPAGYTREGDAYHVTVRPGPQILGERMNAAVASAEVNILGSVPVAPGALAFSDVGNDAFTVTVTPPLSRVTNYVWEYRQGVAGDWTVITPSPASCYPVRTFTGLARNTSYQVRVTAINEAGTGPYSAIALQATTDTPSLAVFGAPVVSSVTGTTASVTAAQISGDPVSAVFAWYRTAATAVAPAGAWVSAATGATFPLAVTGLSAGTEYDFAASGDNVAGAGLRGALAEVFTTGTATAPGDPTNLQAGIVAAGQADVFWRTGTGGRPTSATVQYSDDDGANWYALPAGSGVGVEEANATGLPTNKTCKFRVRLSNAGGNSAFVETTAAYWIETIEIAEALASEGDTLSGAEQDAVNAFVSGTKADGTWDKLGQIYVGFVGTAGAALVNWKAPAERWSSNGTPGFTADRGHVGDGSTAWLGSGKNWSAIPGVAQNSAHIAVLGTCTTALAVFAGTNSGGVTRLLKSASLLTTQINSVATLGADAWGTGSTLALINRTSSEGYDRFLNGAAATAAVAPSSAPQNSPFILLRAALSYAPNSATIHAATAGAGLTGTQAATLNAELRALANAFGVP